MKLFIDAQLPPMLEDWFASTAGIDAIHVMRLGITDDWLIADFAHRERYVVLSKDEDFVGLSWPGRFALVWLRCGNTTNDNLVKLLDARWLEVRRALDAGSMLIELR